MKKRITSIALIVALLATCFAGTYAYLTDKDEAVNVMTLGSVKIEQHEYERVKNADGTYEMVTSAKYGEGYKLQEFTQAKPLNPATGAVTGWGGAVYFDQLGKGASGGQQVLAGINNVQDKFVLVENTGKNSAYVRTIVALEAGSVTAENFEKVIMISCADENGEPWKSTDIGIVNIAGNNYNVIEFVYSGYAGSRHAGGILPAGEWTYGNLSQVYMTAASTNEDVTAIDGNKNGTYDILVISQAVQIEGFENAQAALDTAFGKTADKAAEWFGDMAIPVSSMQELKNNLADGGKVALEENIGSATDTLLINADTTAAIDLQENAMQTQYINNLGTLTVENGEMKTGDPANYGFIGRAGSETTFNNVDVSAGGGGVVALDGAKVVFNNGSVTIESAQTSQRYCFYAGGAGSEITVNDGTFGFEQYKKRAYVCALGGATVTINGGEFGPASNHPTDPTNPVVIDADSTVIIKGGTFGFNPTEWVAPGYVAVQNGTTWTVSAQ